MCSQLSQPVEFKNVKYKQFYFVFILIQSDLKKTNYWKLF